MIISPRRCARALGETSETVVVRDCRARILNIKYILLFNEELTKAIFETSASDWFKNYAHGPLGTCLVHEPISIVAMAVVEFAAIQLFIFVCYALLPPCVASPASRPFFLRRLWYLKKNWMLQSLPSQQRNSAPFVALLGILGYVWVWAVHGRS